MRGSGRHEEIVLNKHFNTGTDIVLNGMCPYNGMYRSNYALCTSNDEHKIITECAKNSIQQYRSQDRDGGGYYLGFIEFDDQGQMHDPSQMAALMHQLRRISLHGDVILLVFVHGWKHNASYEDPNEGFKEDDNIKEFRDVLLGVSRMESALHSSLSKRYDVKPRKIAGVYVGWRGASITAPVLKQLTFWDRKNTAHKVGEGASQRHY